MSKRKIFYILMITLAATLGIASRKFEHVLPTFIADYAGDTFWAFAAYYIFRINLHNRLSTGHTALVSFMFSLFIELSQLYHADWIDSIRDTIIGGLILGFGFVWTDIICYIAGVLLALIVDNLRF